MAQLVGSNSLGLGKLIDGKNQFVHIMYSANVDGSNMTADIQADTKYIGIVTSNSETAPTNPSDYSWGRFVGTSGTSSYTWLRYSPNEDGSNMTANPTPETKYIGVAITANNNAPTDYTKYSWALIKGDDGRGISKTEVTYQKSTSGTVIPTGTWVTTIPTVNAGEYLWTRTLFTYTDNTTSSTYSVARSGVSGLGISRSDVDYQKSTSGIVAPTGAWTVTIPTVAANEYLWTRTTITYTDDSTSISYSVGKMGADGKDAQLLYLTASSQIQAFDKDNKPKTTQAITISVKLQNASGTATFVAIPYIGNVAQTAITLGGTGNDRTLLPSQWTNPQWTTIAITATLGSLTDTISVIKVKDGDTGPKGSDGIAGKDGVGLKETVIRYAGSSSGTTAPASGWQSTVPFIPGGDFLWTRTIWTYTDNSSETGYSVSRIGADGNTGKDGIAGKDGVGIKATSIQYAGSTSGTTPPTTGWTASVPTVASGSYLWTKTTWSYTDDTSETGYSVSKMGETGAKGDKGDSATSYWVTPSVNTIQISATKVLNPTTVTFTGYSKTGTANAGLYAGRFNILTSVDGIVYSSKYSSSANQSTYTYTAPADVKFIKAKMYQAGGFTALVDEVTIPIIESAEDLVVSERNLLLKSNVPYSDTSYGTWWKMTEFMEEGVDYTLKVKGTIGAGKTYMAAFLDGGIINLGSLKDNGDGTHSVTFKGKKGSRTDYNALYIYFIPGSVTVTNTIEWIKLVKGNTMFSQWSPAPEEAQLYTAWSNNPDGSDMVRTYPNENLIPKGIEQLNNFTTFINATGTKELVDADNPLKQAVKIRLSAITGNYLFYLSNFKRMYDFVKNTSYALSFDIKGTKEFKVSSVSLNQATVNSSNWTGTVGTSYQRIKIIFTPQVNSSEAINLNFHFFVPSTEPTVLNNDIYMQNFKIETVKSTTDSATIYTTSPKDDPVKAEMAYIGYSPKDSNDPKDYVWGENPKAKGTFKRWSNDPNGLIDMTDTYPNENLFVGSVSEYRTAGVGAWNGGMGFTSLLEDIGVKVGDSVTLRA